MSSTRHQRTAPAASGPAGDRFEERPERGAEGSRGGGLPRWAALLCAATAAAWAVDPVLPGHAGYLDAFAPAPVPAVAAVLGAVCMVAARTGRPWVPAARAAVLAGTTAAGVLLLWSAGGLLFDGLRVAALATGGGFMPTEVDWAGLPTRLAALAAALLVAFAGLRFARITAGACLRCGRDGTENGRVPGRWPAAVAAAVALPYPVLKTLWSLGIGVGLGPGGSFAHDLLAWLPVLPSLIGVGLCLALVHRTGWGLPRWLLLAAGWFGTVLLATVGLPGGYTAVDTLLQHGLAETLGGIRSWVYALFYLSWLVWAPAMGAATWNYQQRTRGHCGTCSAG